MLFLAIITLILLATSLYIEKKDILSPTVIFNIVWSIILILFNLQLFETIKISDEVVLVFFIMIFCFNIGAILYNLYKNKHKGNVVFKIGERVINAPGDYKLRKWIFIIFSAITIFVLLIDEIDIIKNLLSGKTFSYIMQVANGKGTVEINGTFKVLAYLFIVHPMCYAISPICAVETLVNKKKSYLLLNIIIIALAVAHHGGRIYIISMLVCYLVVAKRNNFDIKSKIKKIVSKLKYALVILISLLIFIIVSDSRGIEDIWLSFYAYLICCIPLSSIYTGSILSNYIATTGGMLSLQGLFYPLFVVLNYVGVKSPKCYLDSFDVLNLIENNYVSIGNYSSTGINYFLPAGMYPYIDGGFFLEIIIMLVLGYVLSAYYRSVKINNNEKNVAAYSIMFLGIVLSFMKLFTQSYGYFLGLFYLLTIFYKKTNLKQK